MGNIMILNVEKLLESKSGLTLTGEDIERQIKSSIRLPPGQGRKFLEDNMALTIPFIVLLTKNEDEEPFLYVVE
jgi:hypothetical protein|tara:strand:- start:179 stop:400 length:222 start_codon:yes stop_codon:yes gene_type:complete